MQDYPLIPRRVLFGNPSRMAPRVSPDGRHLSWIAPRDGVLNLWVALTSDIAAGAADALGATPPLVSMDA